MGDFSTLSLPIGSTWKSVAQKYFLSSAGLCSTEAPDKPVEETAGRIASKLRETNDGIENPGQEIRVPINFCQEITNLEGMSREEILSSPKGVARYIAEHSEHEAWPFFQNKGVALNPPAKKKMQLFCRNACHFLLSTANIANMMFLMACKKIRILWHNLRLT